MTHDLPAAARRHLEAAQTLQPTKRHDVAGYLYGIAAECALKHFVAQHFGLTPESKTEMLYAHFPALRTLLRSAAQGRRAQKISQLIAPESFMQGWDVRLRYTDGKSILPAQVAAWEKQAKDSVSLMDTF